jgi:hypothetical protein
VLQKVRCNADAAGALDICSVTAAIYPSGKCVTPQQQLGAAATGVSTLPTIVAAVGGKRQQLLLQSECKGNVSEMLARLPGHKSALHKPSSEQEKLSLAGTT